MLDWAGPLAPLPVYCVRAPCLPATCQVLHYPLDPLMEPSEADDKPHTAAPDGSQPPARSLASAVAPESHQRYVRAVDGALPPALLGVLRGALAPGSRFWREHGYGRVGYFSYMHQLVGEGGGGWAQSDGGWVKAYGGAECWVDGKGLLHRTQTRLGFARVPITIWAAHRCLGLPPHCVHAAGRPLPERNPPGGGAAAPVGCGALSRRGRGKVGRACIRAHLFCSLVLSNPRSCAEKIMLVGSWASLDNASLPGL